MIPSPINPLGAGKDLAPAGYVFLPDGVDFWAAGGVYDTAAADGTAFDTELILEAGMRLRLEMQPHATRNYARQPLGTHTDGQDAFLALMPNFLCWGTPAGSVIPYTYGDKLLFEASLDGKSIEMTANGQSASKPFTPQNEETIWLGCTNRTTTSWNNFGRPTPMRFWRLEFWKNECKIADMRPMKSMYGEELQIYDTVRRMFLTKLYGNLQEPTNEI